MSKKRKTKKINAVMYLRVGKAEQLDKTTAKMQPEQTIKEVVRKWQY